MCMVRVTNSLSHYQRILSQRTLTLTLQIKNLTQPNQTKQTKPNKTNKTKSSGAYLFTKTKNQKTHTTFLAAGGMRRL